MENLHGKSGWNFCMENLFGIFKNYHLEFLIFKNKIYLYRDQQTAEKLIFKNKEKII